MNVALTGASNKIIGVSASFDCALLTAGSSNLNMISIVNTGTTPTIAVLANVYSTVDADIA